MPCYQAYACRRSGELIGSSEGQALVREADERLRNEGIEDPKGWTKLYAPGFGAH